MTLRNGLLLAHLAKEQGNVSEAIKMLKEALNTELPFAYRKPPGISGASCRSSINRRRRRTRNPSPTAKLIEGRRAGQTPLLIPAAERRAAQKKVMASRSVVLP